jgi:nicotinamide mononucleotide transporter
MVVGCALGTLILGGAFAAFTDAALPFWDNGVFVASLLAMWLTARKKIENWIFWFVIDVVSVGLYWIQGLPLYAGLYFVYLAMAVAGWHSWRRSMDGDDTHAARPQAAAAAGRHEP